MSGLAQQHDDRAAERIAREPKAWEWMPIAAALAYLGLTLHAARVETPTADEFAHVPAGVAAWRQGRTDLYRVNPPLLKRLLAAPVAADASVTAPIVVEPPMQWGPWEYGHRFQGANRAQYLTLMFRARWVAIGLGLLAGLVVFAWARDVFGLRAAAVVTSLFLLCPNVLAHGHLATIDMGALTTILLAIFALRWCHRDPTPARRLLAGAALGLALATKFIAVLVLPAFAWLAILYRWRATTRPPARRLLDAFADLAWIAAAALVVLNASLGFEDSFRAIGDFTFRSQFALALQSALPAWTPLPLPREWLLGFDAAKEISEHGEFGSYLMGQWSEHGWWYYNAVALAVKLPVAILALLAVSIPFWRRSDVPRIELYALLIPLGTLVVVFSTASNLNIGILHVLPSYPFLFRLLGPGFMTTRSRRRESLSLALAGAAAAATAVNVATLHPDYLTFFNAIAGGPAHGSEWLLDSNLDWGQDLYRVPAAVAAIDPAEKPYLLYFGLVDPALYGLQYRLLPATPVEGIIAVSENFLWGYSYLTIAPGGGMVGVAGDTAAWLREREPVRRLGSIRIYDTRPSGGAP